MEERKREKIRPGDTSARRGQNPYTKHVAPFVKILTVRLASTGYMQRSGFSFPKPVVDQLLCQNHPDPLGFSWVRQGRQDNQVCAHP